LSQSRDGTINWTGPGYLVEEEPPGLLERAASFAAAVAEHVAAGFPETSTTEASRRLAICHACPGGHYRAERDICDLCGCSMRLKVTWAEQRCPAGYWPAESRTP
jgi:hypothetical protein